MKITIIRTVVLLIFIFIIVFIGVICKSNYGTSITNSKLFPMKSRNPYRREILTNPDSLRQKDFNRVSKHLLYEYGEKENISKDADKELNKGPAMPKRYKKVKKLYKEPNNRRGNKAQEEISKICSFVTNNSCEILEILNNNRSLSLISNIRIHRDQSLNYCILIDMKSAINQQITECFTYSSCRQHIMFSGNNISFLVASSEKNAILVILPIESYSSSNIDYSATIRYFSTEVFKSRLQTVSNSLLEYVTEIAWHIILDKLDQKTMANYRVPIDRIKQFRKKLQQYGVERDFLVYCYKNPNSEKQSILLMTIKALEHDASELAVKSFLKSIFTHPMYENPLYTKSKLRNLSRVFSDIMNILPKNALSTRMHDDLLALESQLWMANTTQNLLNSITLEDLLRLYALLLNLKKDSIIACSISEIWNEPIILTQNKSDSANNKSHLGLVEFGCEVKEFPISLGLIEKIRNEENRDFISD